MRIKILLSEPNRLLIKELHDGLALHGFPDIRPAHSQVFQYLDASGSRITELAERAQMTKQSMSVLVADMEKGGYLLRVKDKSDNRAFLLKPTARGKKVFEVAGKLIQNIIADWNAKLGEEKMKELMMLLEELNAKIK